MRGAEAYPLKADDETKAFVRFWFDATNRIQLAALSQSIFRVRDLGLRDLLWCAFSRLIITKTLGVSRAMDVSHSRPHRCYNIAPLKAFEHFERAVKHIIAASPFADNTKRTHSSVTLGDARNLPLASNSIDIVITSPPYLNAIDYLRGHKMTLVWMGYSVASIRSIRSTNVGTETANTDDSNPKTEQIMREACRPESLTARHCGMLRQYVRDMRGVLKETHRVLRTNRKAVFVVGDCTLRDTFISNSRAVAALAREVGMVVERIRYRPLPDNRRYLPPPRASSAANALHKRLREEVVISMFKP